MEKKTTYIHLIKQLWEFIVLVKVIITQGIFFPDNGPTIRLTMEPAMHVMEEECWGGGRHSVCPWFNWVTY